MTASKFPQLVRCPRSVLQEPEDVGKRGVGRSPAAIRGTKIHSVIEQYILNGLGAAQSKARELDIIGDFSNIDFQLIKAIVGKYYDKFVEHSMAMDKNGFVRSIKSYSEITEDDVVAGTADLILWSPRLQSLIVLDWKTGLDRVESRHNEQLMCLAYLFIVSMGINPQKINIEIACPVVGPNDDHYHTYWSTDTFEIKKFMDKIVAALSNPIEMAGAHCRYCRFKSNCKAFKEDSDRAIQELDVLEAV